MSDAPLVEVDLEIEPGAPEPQSQLERRVRRWWRWSVALAAPLLATLLATGRYLVTRTAADERAQIEREQLLLHVADYERRIRTLEDATNRVIQRVEDLTRGGRTDRGNWDIAPIPTTPTRTP